jgi:cysteine desulfuration protein SufE
VTAEQPQPPAALRDLLADFAALAAGERLQLLVELGEQLPALPTHVAARRGELEPVAECQSPVFVLVELERTGPEAESVRVYVTAPSQAPTTRGFAALMCLGLDGASPAQVLAVPDDVSALLDLAGVVSPLRLRGMNGLLHRIKRQLRERLDADSGSPRGGAVR